MMFFVMLLLLLCELLKEIIHSSMWASSRMVNKNDCFIVMSTREYYDSYKLN